MQLCTASFVWKSSLVKVLVGYLLVYRLFVSSLPSVQVLL